MFIFSGCFNPPSGSRDSTRASLSSPPPASSGVNVALSVEEKLDQILEFQRGLQKQLPAIDAKLNNVLSRLEAVKPPQTREQPEADTLKQVLFRSGRSIAHLEAATNFDLVPVPGSNALYCKKCVPDFTPALHVQDGVKVLGVYKYDFSLGSSFNSDEILPPMLKNLKVAVQSHFEGQKHKANAAKRDEAARIAQGRFDKDRCVAARAMRTGYFVLKRSLAHATYEDLVFMQVKNGLPMGDLNHSTAFMRTFRTQVHDVLREKLARYVAGKACVSVVADKVTLCKRSVDITAIVVTVPEAPVAQTIQAFVISAPVVVDASGDSLSQEIVQSLATIGITRPDQLSSICMNGQYFLSKVPAKVVKLMSETDPTRSQPCVPAMWDGAHLLNLADGDVRKSKDCQWVDKTLGLMTAMTKRHTHGKGFESLMERGAERGEELLHPKLWSSTRFAPHASRTIAAFLRNAGAIADLLAERVRDGTADPDVMLHHHLLKGKRHPLSVGTLHFLLTGVMPRLSVIYLFYVLV